MKIVKTILVVILALILVLIAAAVIFIKTFDVNRFKPQIISQAKSVLNRQVDFEKADLGISLTEGVSLKIKNLAVGENPVFKKGDFLNVKNISLTVDALAYLFQKRISIPGISIDSPHTTIIRQKDGGLNVQSLAAPQQAPVSTLAPPVLPLVLVSSLKVNQGVVNYIDRSFDPALTLEISDINASADKISLSEPFPFVVEAAVLSSQKNIRIEGKAQVDLKTSEVTLSELKGASDLSSILLKKIPDSFPMTKGAVLPEILKGKADMRAEKITVGPKGLVSMAADVSVTDGALKFKELALPVEKVAMKAKVTPTKIIVDHASAVIGEGQLNGTGTIEDYLSTQSFNGNAGAKDIKVQDLIAQDKAPVKIEGIASGQIKLKGQGFSPQALNASLTGEGTIFLKQAKLKGINVLRTVLDKISLIPGLGEKMQAGLPQRYQKKLTGTDTALSDMELPVVIENGRILIKDAALGADEFTFKGQMEAGFDGAYSMEGSFLIPQELSGAMVKAVPQLQYLLNENKEIFIPLKISGEAGEMKFTVDAEYIGKKLLMNQARQQLLKVIDKAVGAKEPQAASAPDATGVNTAPEGSGKPSAEDVVGGLLGTIFKR